ncbi:Tim10/DDP family zinc finger-domain-containing protein [Pisolithus croceorrhizus]|nr:Tim10/DDP family zinc finger-domain-containing protein [Pisolithus croceorrhizus]
MSLFGRGAPTPSGAVNQERIEMATISCHSKCISPRYAEGDLNKGESVCIDRCVAKFFEVNKRVGEKMQSAGANAQATGSTSFSL